MLDKHGLKHLSQRAAKLSTWAQSKWSAQELQTLIAQKERGQLARPKSEQTKPESRCGCRRGLVKGPRIVSSSVKMNDTCQTLKPVQIKPAVKPRTNYWAHVRPAPVGVNNTVINHYNPCLRATGVDDKCPRAV
jgi:hypothetical protein